jgi:hypothetical protein
MQPVTCPRCFCCALADRADGDVRFCPNCERFFFVELPQARPRLAPWFLCPAMLVTAILTMSALMR